MQLGDAFEGPCHTVELRELLDQVRDIGERLHYVTDRYDRLVQDLTGRVDLQTCSRAVHVVNRHLVDAVNRLQEVLVVGNEARRGRVRATLRRMGPAAPFPRAPHPESPSLPADEDSSSATSAPLVAAGG
jgi:hypothetical protein